MEDIKTMKKEQKYSSKIWITFVFVFVLLLSLSLFTGCGNTPPNNGDDETLDDGSLTPNVAGLFDPVTNEQTYTWDQLIENNYITVDSNTVSKGTNSGYRDLTGKLVVSNQISVINEGAFQYWGHINYVVIPEGVTSIGNSAFDACSNLLNVTIPSTVTQVGQYAFWSCIKLVEFYNLSEAGLYDAYYEDYTDYVYTTLDEPSKVSIANDGWVYYTKDGDKKLLGYLGNETEITLPSDITEVYQFALSCASITKLTIPENITKIGIRAFECTYDLTEINFNATSCDDFTYNNPVFDRAGENGTGITLNIGANVTKVPAYLLNISGTNGYRAPKVKTVNFEESSQIIPIHDRAFCCSNIETVNFNNRPVSLENGGAFSNASITSITIPQGSTLIGSYAFSSCSKLTSITIPEGVTRIGASAFWECSKLTSVTIPESLTFVGINAFKSCSATISFKSADGWFVSQKADKSNSKSASTNSLLTTYKNNYWWFKNQD